MKREPQSWQSFLRLCAGTRQNLRTREGIRHWCHIPAAFGIERAARLIPRWILPLHQPARQNRRLSRAAKLRAQPRQRQKANAGPSSYTRLSCYSWVRTNCVDLLWLKKKNRISTHTRPVLYTWSCRRYRLGERRMGRLTLCPSGIPFATDRSLGRFHY